MTRATILRDAVSSFQLELYARTLAGVLPGCALPRSDGTVPKGWHFVYFPTAPVESELLADGYDRVPDAPATIAHELDAGRFVRRWRGGRLEFHTPLRTSDAECAVYDKVTTADGWRMSVASTRQMRNAGGPLAVLEHRELVYMAAAGKSRPVRPPAAAHVLARSTFTPSATLLFRFSALTFNAHRIHFDGAYARDVENMGLVMHGGLAASLMLTWLQYDPAVRAQLETAGVGLDAFEYLCVDTIRPGVPVDLVLTRGRNFRAWIVQDGGVKVKSTVL
ncbi:uncharacterized protein V1510DRAFT_106687 [Dipodascopsis tothii]|uniref:uncharacterized protein n=1 Tax=Dipodascopsis tothii TaxID=44089 RepID=UPI0034CFB683